MPNTFTDNRDRWLLLSDVDYLGQFVKAWLAFNAWYRGAYSESQDRKIINEFKWQVNPVLSKLRPLLSNGGSEDAQQFRGDVGLLHHRLQNYELHTGKDSNKERISFQRVYLRDNPPSKIKEHHGGFEITVERGATGGMRSTVVNRSGNVILNETQQRYSLLEVEGSASFAKLTPRLQGFLRGIYGLPAMAPREIADLTYGEEAAISCGSYEFRCSPDRLFAGVVEVVYLMRCTLFHGELTPTKDAGLVYEPAYGIVRRFLNCIS